MKNLYFLRSMFLSALAAMAITACSDSDEGGNDGEGPGGGETPAPTSSLTVNEKAEAQTFTYDMKATKEALAIDASGDWTLTCDDEEAPTWCTPDITEGKSGKSTLTFDVKVPLMPSKANYTLTLKDDAEVNVKVTVEQEPTGPWIGASTKTLEFPKEGASLEVTVYVRNIPDGYGVYPTPQVGRGQFLVDENTALTDNSKLTITAKAYSSSKPNGEIVLEAWDDNFMKQVGNSFSIEVTQLAE